MLLYGYETHRRWIFQKSGVQGLVIQVYIRPFQRPLQDEKALASPIGLAILGGCLSIKNYPQIKFLGTYIYRYGFIILIFGIGFGVLVLANLKLKRKNRKL